MEQQLYRRCCSKDLDQEDLQVLELAATGRLAAIIVSVPKRLVGLLVHQALGLGNRTQRILQSTPVGNIHSTLAPSVRP